MEGTGAKSRFDDLRWVSHSFPDAPMTVATYTCPAKSIARWSGPDIHDFRQADGEDSWRTNIECLQNVTLPHLIYVLYSLYKPEGQSWNMWHCILLWADKAKNASSYSIISTRPLASQQAWPPYILVSPTANSLRMLRWSCCSSWVKACAATNAWRPRFEKAKAFDSLN